MSTLRIATRGSALALAQSGQVGGELAKLLGCEFELLVVRTSGDRIQDQSLAELGGKGLFVKEIEEALLAGDADLAVHSAKDLPGHTPPGLVLAAFPRRGDARDACIVRERGNTLATLPRRARVGTGSVRRKSQLLAWRADLEIVPLRGNVDTRLRKLAEERLDAVILACAGLERLGLGERIDERIDPAVMLPAVGQGVLALETRAGDPLAAELAAALDDADTRVCIEAERAFLVALAGDCSVPLAAFAECVPDARIRLRALLASSNGDAIVRAEAEMPGEHAAQAGRDAAREVLARGGEAILASLPGRQPR